MIRPLTPFDAVHCTFLSESEKVNRAYTLRDLGKQRPSSLSLLEATRAGTSLRSKSCAWACFQGTRVMALVSARQRSGRQSWEVSHLFFRRGGESHLADLLEKVARSAASRGGERVFIRLLRQDPLVDIARHSGFFPRVPEVLYARASRPGGDSPHSADPPMRKKSPGDDHDLFRLYNAATPSEVRCAIGMTLEQWSASRERVGRRAQEFVLQDDERVTAWLSATRLAGAAHLAAMAHPDHERSLPSVVDFGLQRLSGARAVHCLVPEYQVALERVLKERGFAQVADYLTLVKTMAISVKAKEDVRARVAAPTT